MRKFKLLIVILSSFLLTGCWNYNELNQLALITGVSIDKKDDQFIINYMISNSSKSDNKSGSSETGTVLYEGIGKTLTEASQNINQKLPKIPYLEHTEVVVVSEEIAKDDIINTMDFFLRNPETRKEIYLLVSKGTEAKNTLSILTPLESFPSENIKSNIVVANYEVATTATIKFSEFLSIILTKGIEPTLGVIEVEGDIEKGQSQESNDKSKQEAVIKLTSKALFKKDKMVHITNKDEATAIDVLNKNLDNIYINIPCDDREIVAYVESIDSKIKIDIENNKPKAKIDIKGSGYLLEVNCKINLEDDNIINDIQKKVEDKVKEFFYNGINITQKYNTDILGFGNIIYKHHPKYWNNIETDWDDNLYKNLEISINPSIDLYSKGSLEQSIKEELK